MFKSLSGLFSSGPALPYHIDEEHDEAWGQPLWKHYRGRSKVRGPRASGGKAVPDAMSPPTPPMPMNLAHGRRIPPHVLLR